VGVFEPLCRDDTNLGQMPAKRADQLVALRHQHFAHLRCMSISWFSGVRMAIKRIEGLVTASQIPAAPGMSMPHRRIIK
jgi:hypothetical protein